MSDVAGAFGDRRRAASVGRLYGSMVERSSVVIRKLGVDRGGELSAHRVPSSGQETVGCLARRTGAAVAGRRLVAAQDTTGVNFPGRQSRGLGPAGRRGATPGFFIHATVAVDADTDAVLGLVDAAIWTRDRLPAAERRQRALAEKGSQRWLSAAEAAAERLAAAAVVVVGDRESDIHALFSRRPAAVRLLVRAAQSRTLEDDTRCSMPPKPGRCWAGGRSRCRRAAPATAGERPRSRCAPARCCCAARAMPCARATRTACPSACPSAWSRRSRRTRPQARCRCTGGGSPRCRRPARPTPPRSSGCTGCAGGSSRPSAC